MEIPLILGNVSSNFSIHELGGVPGGDPRVLRNTQPMHLHYNFTQTGFLFSVFPPNTFEWEVTAMYEVYGNTESTGQFRTLPADIPYVAGSPHNYVGALTIPQTSLPDDCVCRIIVQLSLRIAGGGPIIGTGFQDMGIWQFYG